MKTYKNVGFSEILFIFFLVLASLNRACGSAASGIYNLKYRTRWYPIRIKTNMILFIIIEI